MYTYSNGVPFQLKWNEMWHKICNEIYLLVEHRAWCWRYKYIIMQFVRVYPCTWYIVWKSTYTSSVHTRVQMDMKQSTAIEISGNLDAECMESEMETIKFIFDSSEWLLKRKTKWLSGEKPIVCDRYHHPPSHSLSFSMGEGEREREKHRSEDRHHIYNSNNDQIIRRK